MSNQSMPVAGMLIHNFFEQEGLSQEQHQSQVVDGSWSSFNNGLVGNQRQIDPSLIANLKTYNTQQPVDLGRSQSSNSQHDLNFTEQPIRSEFSRSLVQEHQQLTNGYMHGNLGLQTMPNGANLTGVDVESSSDRLSTRGLTPELHKIPMRFEMGESPVNYDFLVGQQQLNTQLPGMLQPLPRQQMTFNDMQLLKHQVMVKQMHEYQMQQQLQKQQLEARQFNSLNSDTVNGSRSSDNQSHPLIDGIPLQDASSNCWQRDRMTVNTNWMHHDISPAAQGSSSGLMVTPEHGQTNLLAQQFEPSLYGMSVSGTNAPQNGFSSVQMNRLAAQHGSANRSSSLTNQPTSFMNQGGVQDSHMLPRSTYQEKVLFTHAAVPGSNNIPSFENFQQDDSRERNISVQEKFGQMEGSNPSEKSFMKVPGNITPSQKSTTLDPIEETILFGSDDNLWDAFGSSTDMSLTGNLMSSSSDLYDACPSLQSGSWSALMQSAVAETSSDDAGVHGWANDNTGPHVNSHTGINALSERFHNDSTRAAVKHLPGKRNNVSDHGLLEKPMTQLSQMAGNMFHSSSSGIVEQNNSCSIRKNEGIEDRFGIWKAASNPNLATMIEQKNHFTQNPVMQRTNYGFGIAGAGKDTSASRDVQGNIQQHLDNNSVEKANPQQKSRDGSQILESYASNHAGSNEMVNAHHFSMLPGGKDTQSGHVSSRPSVSRKFQYHPMGNIDVTNESCQEKVSYLPPTLEHASVGNQGYFGQSKSHGQPSMNMRIDRGPVSQNDLNCTNEAFNGMGSENSPSTSASADRSVDRCNQVKSASSRQTMLELLHKVDQSPEISSETNVSGIQEANTSAEYGGQFRHSQSSASQGFSLQLAPPSQLAPSPDNVQLSRNSLQPLNTFNTVGSLVDGTHSVQSSKHFIMQQMSGCAPGAQAPSSESLLHSDTDQLLKVDKPKKRKTATSELLSWNKEVMQDPQRLKTRSEAEVNWARATNRVAEKVEFETLCEDGPPIRSKKRLIISTHLIQQLFSPPPARVISLVASTNYEFVAYTAARAALGDACSSSCNDRSERFSPPINSNPLSERTKTEKISDQYISKAAEDFMSRTRKLETDFTGLENGTTIQDLRVEVQDLEKFAVINRFAKFHPPSSSMDRTVNSFRLNPQRYVTIAPMPQNIPDRVQCLSLSSY